MMNNAARDIFSLTGRASDRSRTVARIALDQPHDAADTAGIDVPCREFKKRGREKGGAKEKEMGVCPAWPGHGFSCAGVARTFRDGKVQETFAPPKKKSAIAPDATFSKEHPHQRDKHHARVTEEKSATLRPLKP